MNRPPSHKVESNNPEMRACVSRLADQFRALERPDCSDLQKFMAKLFPGADLWAPDLHCALLRRRYKTEDGELIRDWRSLAKAYANYRELKARGVANVKFNWKNEA